MCTSSAAAACRPCWPSPIWRWPRSALPAWRQRWKPPSGARRSACKARRRSATRRWRGADRPRRRGRRNRCGETGVLNLGDCVLGSVMGRPTTRSPPPPPCRHTIGAVPNPAPSMYQALNPSRSSTLVLRRLNYHVRHWGPEESALPPLVLLHGWMDVSASYQFTVDALQQERRIIAPDWRGFGLSGCAQADHYFFADYLADLDLLLDHHAPGQAVDLVGHSMGGNVAMMYAGVRPHPGGKKTLKRYASAADVARRLMKTNPRLAQDKAQWLAQHWARPNAQGQWEILGDPAHKVASAQLFRVDEALALYAQITAPVLAIEAGSDSLGQWWNGRYRLDEYHQRLTHVRDCRTAVVQDAGHMLHHDQPAQVAQCIERFLNEAHAARP